MAASAAATIREVVVHPVALFTMVDSYERRNEDSHRVVGTLLGMQEDDVVIIKNCFTVPHIETQEEVAFDKEYASSMLDLYQTASPAEEVVGWFATSNDVTGHSTLIHEYYSIECKIPVHLTLDTQLKSGKLDIKAFVSSPLGVPGGTMGLVFTPIPVKITYYEPELTAVESFAKNKGGSKKPMDLATSMEHISLSTERLVKKLEDCLEYVKGVLDGSRPADNELGQKLMAVVGSVPQMDPSKLEKMMNDNMQDLLMVLYLASLTKTQLSVGTKLNHIV